MQTQRKDRFRNVGDTSGGVDVSSINKKIIKSISFPPITVAKYDSQSQSVSRCPERRANFLQFHQQNTL